VAAQPTDTREFAAVRALVRETGEGAGVEGFLGVYLANFGADTTDAHLKELAALRPQGLTAVYMRARGKSTNKGWVSGVTPAGLKELAALPNLKLLHVQYDCGNEDLRAIAEIKTLEKVTIWHGYVTGFSPYVTEEGLGHLARLPKLQKLILSSTKITDACWEPISKIASLETLQIDTAATGKGIGHLSALVKLKELDLSHSRANDEALAVIGSLKTLRTLDLSYTKISDAGLKGLAGLSGLEVLKLNNTEVTDAGVRHLAGMAGLQTLHLDDTRVGDDGAKALAGLKALRGLRLGRTKVGDVGVKALAGQGGIVNLYLSNTAVTDDGFNELAKLKKLYILDVDRTKVTPEAVSRLKTALPYCNVYHSRPDGGRK
jgi:Leucine-rich repeat (LRR) protein